MEYVLISTCITCKRCLKLIKALHLNVLVNNVVKANNSHFTILCNIYFKHLRLK